jgi:hypothetical protein
VGKKTIVIKSSMRVPRWELIFDANVFTLLSNHTIFLKRAAPLFAPASVRWVCSAGAGSGKLLHSQPDQNAAALK